MSAHTTRRLGLGIAALALMFLPVSHPAAMPHAAPSRSQGLVPEYMVLDLGPLLGDRNVARGLNLSGHIAGRSGSHQGTGGRAFIWTPALGAQFLGTLAGGDFSGASAVNASGQVVGSSNTSTALRAFLWTRLGGLEDLGALPGDTSSRALAINDAGRVTGYSSGSGGTRAFVWTRQTGMHRDGHLTRIPGQRRGRRE